LINYSVRASQTDSNIGFELAQHQTYYNPECDSRNLLVVHLLGSFDNPNSTSYYPTLAANNGFHVVVLKYSNLIAAQTACADSDDDTCYYKFRKEIIEGIDLSNEVEVDSINSINNRLFRLLIHLNEEFPENNWGHFISSDNEVDWGHV